MITLARCILFCLRKHHVRPRISKMSFLGKEVVSGRRKIPPDFAASYFFPVWATKLNAYILLSRKMEELISLPEPEKPETFYFLK
jgi:hypothetical protein